MCQVKKMASSFNTKCPPLFGKDVVYETWKKDIKIWQELTDLDKKKQALAIHLTLSGKARQASGEINVEDLKKDTGVDTLLTKLDNLFLPEKSRRQFNVFCKLYNMRRQSDTPVSDFVDEFERAYFSFTQEGMTLPGPVMAFMLLASCNLTEQQFQLVMSAITDVNFDNMKSVLKRIFSADLGNSFGLSGEVAVKLEPVFYSEEKSVNMLRGRSKGARRSTYTTIGRGNPYWHRGASAPRFNERRGTSNMTRYRGRGNGRCLNPLGPDGQPSRCAICDSRYHWARDCPHSYENADSDSLLINSETEHSSNNHEVEKPLQTVDNTDVVQLSLLTGDTGNTNESSDKLDRLLSESYGSVILDTGCSKTVCGERWLNAYVHSLSEYEKSIITEEPTNSTFTFGDGKAVASMKRVTLPCQILGMKATICTDVVKCNLPLLLSKQAMKRAKMTIDFEHDTVTVMGKTTKLENTSSGHYRLSISA